MSDTPYDGPDAVDDANATDGSSVNINDRLDAILGRATQAPSGSARSSGSDTSIAGSGDQHGNGGQGGNNGISGNNGGGSNEANRNTTTMTPLRPPADPITIPPQFKSIMDKLGISVVLQYVNARREILAPYEMRQALNPELTSAMAEKYWTRGVPGLEGWRNVLVVLPLTVTWLSLGLAALAYEESQPALAKVYKSSVEPDFFQLWQQGFPQLSAVHLWGRVIPLTLGGTRILTFTDVALLDVAVLLLMLALTALSQIIIGLAVSRARKLEVWLYKTLHEMSVNSVVWSLAPNDQQPRWAAEVQSAINDLNGALANVSSSVTAFKRELVEQGEIVRSAVAQTGAVPTVVNDLITASGKALEAQKLLNSVLPSIRDNLAMVAGSQTSTTDTWQLMSNKLGSAIDSIVRLVDMLGGTTDLREQAEEIRRRYEEALSGGYYPRPSGNTLSRLYERSRSAMSRISQRMRRGASSHRR